jgi:restriction endonuclease S subunit
MKATKVKSSNLSNNGLRMDASLYLSEGIQILSLLNAPQIKTKPLKDITSDIFYGNRSRRVYVTNPKNGIPFIKGADITKSDFSSLKLISKKKTKNLESYALKEGWTLITRSGSIGNTAFVNEDFIGKAASDDIIRVCPKDIPAGFLYAYLSSKLGNTLLTQNKYGAVIQHIEPEHIENIPVPIFSESKQQEIHNLIVESAKLRVEANRLLEEAKILLEKEINVYFQKESFKIGSNNIKDIFSSLQCRLDPPALISDGVETINKLKKNGVAFKSLSECNTYVYRPGIFKRSYVEKGYPYIKGSELFDNNPFLRCQYLSKTKTPFVEQMLLRENQILITCAGSCGQVKLITKEFEDKGAIGSQDIIRVEAKDSLFTTEYLFIYFQLPFVFDYIQSMKYGSVIERIEPFHVESVPVFVPTEKVSKEITDKISTYKKNMHVAFNKEAQAISLVEKEIESWQQS